MIEIDCCFYRCNWYNSSYTMGPYANAIPKPIYFNCICKNWDDYCKKFRYTWTGFSNILQMVKIDRCFHGYSWYNSGYAIGPYTNAILKPICPDYIGKS